MITFVTALYDINRETQGDGRRFDDYLAWLLQTLTTKANYIIYTESKVVPYLPKQNNIKVIVTDVEDIPLYSLKKKMDTILTNPNYLSKMQDTSRVECKLSMYNIIQYSKFEWLKEAINYNPFNSEYFFWIDAGCSRFFAGLSEDFPNPNKMPQKFYIQGNMNTGNILINEDYKWMSDCVLVGTFFGGYKHYVKNVCNLVIDYLINEMLFEDMINNEQIALAMVWNKRPELFDVYINLDGTHLPILKTLN
jgi:hypothetical protein